MSIKEVLQLGENSEVEFKEKITHNDSLAKEIVAFANTNGGVVYLGISDSKEITGVINEDGLEEKIINICRNNIIPSVIPLISKFLNNEKIIYKLKIEKGKNKPYKVKSSNKFYIRAGSISIEPTNDELVRLFQAGGSFHFEINSCAKSDFSDLDTLKFRDYCENYRGLEFEENKEELIKILNNLELIDDINKLTIVGALFFGKNINKLLPQAGIDLNYYAGKDQATKIIDNKAVSDSLPNLIQTALSFVSNNSRISSEFIKNETIREDIAEYEPFVVRELIANAFCHRDWSIFGQKIRINMFSDRMEIFSPGTLPNTLTLLHALNGISYYRNPIIALMLKDYKFTDKLGRGLVKIMRFYKDKKLKLPEFIISDNFVLVKIWKRVSKSVTVHE
ncbi:MAG: AAA family ATPase [Desulfobacteraceae bacterium 4572_19]|nr:MAG: AAA family ATPase [Desulfobacteraceae bacterium 4572_19]